MSNMKSGASAYSSLPTGDHSEGLEAPPSFEESSGHVAINIDETYVPDGGEVPPPDFAPYEAEFMLSGSGTVISHDTHLNQDGEALYRFLLSQACKPPTYLLHCQGTHEETHTRLVHRTNDRGEHGNHTESYTETVTDFDFYIDIGRNIVSGPVHWSVGDSEPAYRGKMSKEVDLPDGRRKATRSERNAAEKWQKERMNKGLPPWIGPEWQSGPGFDPLRQTAVLKSSKTLREWADEYCTSPKHLKEFRYQKVMYGWNIQALKDAIHAAIKSTFYRGTVKVDFELQGDRIMVRPDNRLSRALSKPWLKFLLVITLIYPFILLFQCCHSRGGGKWVVCGGAYALKCYQNISENPDASFATPDNDGPQLSTRKTMLTPDICRQTNGGLLRLVGTREGEWFRDWEGTIRSSVYSRLQSKEPMDHPRPNALSNSAASLLDGY